MAHQTFKLISSYDLVPDSQQTEDLFRIEIFQSLEQDTTYRCRIWAYRNYAIQLALPQPPLISHDLLPHEVTYMIDDLELITGITGNSESQILARANAAVAKLCEALRG
jgi:hypothetical protein